MTGVLDACGRVYPGGILVVSTPDDHIKRMFSRIARGGTTTSSRWVLKSPVKTKKILVWWRDRSQSETRVAQIKLALYDIDNADVSPTDSDLTV